MIVKLTKIFSKTQKYYLFIGRSCSRVPKTTVFPEDNNDTVPDFKKVRVNKKPISYLPINLRSLKLLREKDQRRLKPWRPLKEVISEVEPPPDPLDPWVESPQYPEIRDASPSGIKKQFRESWYKQIRDLKTAEEKMLEISKHFSFIKLMLEPVSTTYNILPMQQFLTRTHIIRGSLPTCYLNCDVDKILEQVKEPILEVIRCNLHEQRLKEPQWEVATRPFQKIFRNELFRLEDQKCENIIENVVNIIANAASNHYKHLLDSQVSIQISNYVNGQNNLFFF